MAEYHVGVGIAGIYAGTLNKKGDMWINKTDVTDEALRSVAAFMVNNDFSFVFTIRGKNYRLYFTEINAGEMAESEVEDER